jgi:hypothetical protein
MCVTFFTGLDQPPLIFKKKIDRHFFLMRDKSPHAKKKPLFGKLGEKCLSRWQFWRLRTRQTTWTWSQTA